MTLPTDRLELKTTLLNRFAQQRRSQGWNMQALSEELQAELEQLESSNPTPNPLESPALMGNWRLLYTTSQGILGLDRIPLTELGEVFQCIQGDRVYNVAETQSLAGIGGIVAVAARYTVCSNTRVQVKFERSILGLKSVMGYRSVDEFVTQLETGKRFLAIDLPIPSREAVGQGWLEVTYLDDDLRISRGNEGSIFVLTKSNLSP